VSDYSPAKSASVDDLGAFADPSVAYAELQARFRTLRETNEERFTNLNDEIDKLEFEKSALEDKLKTAAEIIEKLEEEKAAMERNLDSQNEDNLKLSSLEHELRMKSIEVRPHNAVLPVARFC
jgi:predicted RNase H-like nuclease (RuvC/YqgF family)